MRCNLRKLRDSHALKTESCAAMQVPGQQAHLLVATCRRALRPS